jgi:hypothetical protein
MYHQEIRLGRMDWVNLAQNDTRRDFVNVVMHLRVP